MCEAGEIFGVAWIGEAVPVKHHFRNRIGHDRAGATVGHIARRAPDGSNRHVGTAAVRMARLCRRIFIERDDRERGVEGCGGLFRRDDFDRDRQVQLPRALRDDRDRL